jgi:hypothetical protein
VPRRSAANDRLFLVQANLESRNAEDKSRHLSSLCGIVLWPANAVTGRAGGLTTKKRTEVE